MKISLSPGPPFLPFLQWFKMKGYWDHEKVSIFLESQLTYQLSQRKTRSEIYSLSPTTIPCVSFPYLTVSHAHTLCLIPIPQHHTAG